MSDERCNELYDLRGQADRAIYEISKFLEKPEYADHAMECLFNIAILSSAELNHFRFKEPELLKRFASTRTQWPYWLGHEQEGWVKTRMPSGIRQALDLAVRKGTGRNLPLRSSLAAKTTGKIYSGDAKNGSRHQVLPR